MSHARAERNVIVRDSRGRTYLVFTDGSFRRIADAQAAQLLNGGAAASRFPTQDEFDEAARTIRSTRYHRAKC